jgi:restriction system protein
MTTMTRQKTKAKENKVAELIMLSIFGFCIVTAMLDSISIEPNLMSIYFYILLLVVISTIYKPFRMFLFRMCSSLFKVIFKNFYRTSSVIEIEIIDQMNGQEFELYLKRVFERYGYLVELTPRSNDYGADLILRKGTKKYVVQAKCHRNTIGIKAVKEVNGAIKYYKVDGAFVVTNQYFSASAVRLAKANDVLLIDRDELIKMSRLSSKKLKFASAISFIVNK